MWVGHLALREAGTREQGLQETLQDLGCWGRAGARGFWMEGMNPILSYPQQLPVQIGGGDHCLSRRKGSRCWPLSSAVFLGLVSEWGVAWGYRQLLVGVPM